MLLRQASRIPLLRQTDPANPRPKPRPARWAPRSRFRKVAIDLSLLPQPARVWSPPRVSSCRCRVSRTTRPPLDSRAACLPDLVAHGAFRPSRSELTFLVCFPKNAKQRVGRRCEGRSLTSQRNEPGPAPCVRQRRPASAASSRGAASDKRTRRASGANRPDHSPAVSSRSRWARDDAGAVASRRVY